MRVQDLVQLCEVLIKELYGSLHSVSIIEGRK